MTFGQRLPLYLYVEDGREIKHSCQKWLLPSKQNKKQLETKEKRNKKKRQRRNNLEGNGANILSFKEDMEDIGSRTPPAVKLLRLTYVHPADEFQISSC